MATSSDLKNLQLDADDLKALVGTSKRPAVQAQLQGILAATNKQIADLESKLKAEANEIQSQGEPDAASEINATKEAQTEKDSGEQAQAADDKKTPVAPPAVAAGAAFIPIHTFGWDQSDKFVSVYVSEGMEGVKASGAKVDCQFGTDSFDLTIRGHNGKDFRLAREGLDKDIVREKSKVKVKADRVVVMLKKIPGEYGPDHWMDLVPKRKRSQALKDDPTAGIMDMMKDMYDSGDDQMKKTIGEAMLKSQQERAMGGMGGGF